MLKFDEAERPSFVEIGKLVLTSTENTIESPKGEKKGVRSHKSLRDSKTFSMNKLKESTPQLEDEGKKVVPVRPKMAQSEATLKSQQMESS